DDRAVAQIQLVDVAGVRFIHDRPAISEEDAVVARVRERDLVQQLTSVRVQLLNGLEARTRDPQRALVPLDAVDAAALAVWQEEVLRAPARRRVVARHGRRANVRSAPDGTAAEAAAAQV